MNNSKIFSNNIGVSNRYGNILLSEDNGNYLRNLAIGDIVNFEYKWFDNTSINTDYNPMIS